ncbi:MAG: PaaX family transcriptional regulator, partial [Myxococcota bacterium]
MRAPRPKSLILDLLSTRRRGSMPVAALVEAAALFGIAEGSLRVALSRLLAEGRVERDERGAYRLGPAAAPL